MTAVSGLMCLISTAVSSANVSILLLVEVGMSAVYHVYNDKIRNHLLINPMLKSRDKPSSLTQDSNFLIFDL